MNFDHIAFISKNIEASINWYVDHMNAIVLYQDDTWGYIKIGDAKIAFVSSNQHPNHICFKVDDEYISKHLNGKIFKEHRDKSSSCYIRDIDGNHIEFLKWPKKSG